MHINFCLKTHNTYTILILDNMFSLLPQEYAVNCAVGSIDPKEKDNITNTFPRSLQVK